MANKQNLKLAGIVLMVLGIALLVWGFQMADAPANQVAQSITGSSSDAVMYRYIGGAVAIAAGAFLFFRK